jgi:uncharacterized protein YjbK
MEIEVKLQLLGATNHQRLLNLLGNIGKFQAKKMQRNHFLDDENKSLGKVRAALRLRDVGGSKHFVTYKSNGILKDGISRISEQEIEISKDDFNQILNRTQKVSTLAQKVTFLEQLKDICDMDSLQEFGCFTNTRMVFLWNNLCLEVDETQYPFGTAYEVEVEHVDPEMAKGLLETLFKSEQIEYKESTRSKLGTLIAGQLD